VCDLFFFFREGLIRNIGEAEGRLARAVAGRTAALERAVHGHGEAGEAKVRVNPNPEDAFTSAAEEVCSQTIKIYHKRLFQEL